MNCPKCNRENEEGAMYCRYCGSPMHKIESKESNTSSILLLIWVIATSILSLTTFCITKFVDDWYGGPARMVYIGIQIIINLLFLLPAFAIKNKTLKIVGIIIMSLLVIWWVVQNIMWATQSV